MLLVHFSKYRSLESNVYLTKSQNVHTMNTMTKKLSLLTLVIPSLFSVSQAYAATSIGSACPGNGFSGLCFDATKLGPVIGSFITFGFVMLGLVALGFLVWGGVKWLTSEGDKNAVEGARNHIVNAIIGLIVIFLSYLVVNILLAFLTGGKVSLGNLSIPTIGQP